MSNKEIREQICKALNELEDDMEPAEPMLPFAGVVKIIHGMFPDEPEHTPSDVVNEFFSHFPEVRAYIEAWPEWKLKTAGFSTKLRPPKGAE